MPSARRIARQTQQLDLSAEARVKWLESRTAALERHVQYRIRQVQALENQLKDLGAIARHDLELATTKAKRYDELMQTRTMRILRRPRAAYAWLRRLNHDRRA